MNDTIQVERMFPCTLTVVTLRYVGDLKTVIKVGITEDVREWRWYDSTMHFYHYKEGQFSINLDTVKEVTVERFYRNTKLKDLNV